MPNSILSVLHFDMTEKLYVIFGLRVKICKNRSFKRSKFHIVTQHPYIVT